MCVKCNSVFIFIILIAPREIMLNDVHASEHYQVFLRSVLQADTFIYV